MLNTALVVDPRAPEPNWRQDGGSQIWQRRLYFSQFAAAATTGNVDIGGFPGGLMIEGAGAWLITNFAGGGSATATLSIGTTASAAAYFAATSVFSGARKLMVGKTLVPATALNASTPTAAGTVRFQLITDTNTNVLTTGAVDVFLWLRSLALRTS